MPIVTVVNGGTQQQTWLPSGVTAWYDARNLSTTGQTTLPNRVGTGTATLTNGLLALPGSGYVYLPSTASNNISIPKDGGWAGTLHVTATLTDDSTTTFTTTASPILIGNTLLAAGRYKRFDVRDTDANGTLRGTIDLATEAIAQASWTCTTGQTVTVNRSSSGLVTAVVTRPLMMGDGSNDFLQLPADDTPTFTASTGTETVLWVGKMWTAAAGSDMLYSSEGSLDNGLDIVNTTGRIYVRVVGSAGFASRVERDAITSYTSGTTVAVGAVINNGTVAAWSNAGGLTATSSITGVGSLEHTSPRLGSRAYTLSTPADSLPMVFARWGRALTSTELGTASSFLLGNYS